MSGKPRGLFGTIKPAQGLLGSAPTYDTPLAPQQQGPYQQWRSSLPGDLQNNQDYDLQGAYLAAMQANGRAHMGDRFKKPNHMTFSDESQYSTPQTQGGHWSEGANGTFAFWASPWNMQQHSWPELTRYMQEAEPGTPLIAPFDYRLPRGR